MSAKRVALLGGSFDPVHEGHLAMARAAKKQLDVDEVWFVPSNQTPLKDRKLSKATDRLNMLRLALQSEPDFKICDLELKRNGVSYTIDTLKTLKDMYPDVEFFWLIGADQAAKFDKWKDSDQLLQLARFAVIDRDEQLENAQDKDERFLRVAMEPVDVSSSEIRSGRKLNLLPEAVRQYILDHELYLRGWVRTQMDDARYAHSCSVAKLCRELAKAHGYDEHRAYLAGLFHDIAKDMPKSEQFKWIEACFPQAVDEHKAIWHGYVGSEVVDRVFGIHDPAIRNAICNHVKGTSYDPYAMMVFIADKLDPLRGYDSTPLYNACLKDLYNGFLLVKAENKAYLEKEKKNGTF